MLTLPQRTHDAINGLRQEFRDLVAACSVDRPFSVRFVREQLAQLEELLPDLESDILQDLADAVEDAERWDDDDLVVLVEQEAEVMT